MRTNLLRNHLFRRHKIARGNNHNAIYGRPSITRRRHTTNMFRRRIRIVNSRRRHRAPNIRTPRRLRSINVIPRVLPNNKLVRGSRLQIGRRRTNGNRPLFLTRTRYQSKPITRKVRTTSPRNHLRLFPSLLLDRTKTLRARDRLVMSRNLKSRLIKILRRVTSILNTTTSILLDRQLTIRRSLTHVQNLRTTSRLKGNEFTHTIPTRSTRRLPLTSQRTSVPRNLLTFLVAGTRTLCLRRQLPFQLHN